MRNRIATRTDERLLRLIGAKITEYRNAIGITQTDLSMRVHVSRFQMCKHESGSAEMPVTRLSNICKVLQVTLVDFMRAVAKAVGNGR